MGQATQAPIPASRCQLEVATDRLVTVSRAQGIQNIDVDILIDAFCRSVSHREVGHTDMPTSESEEINVRARTRELGPPFIKHSSAGFGRARNTNAAT